MGFQMSMHISLLVFCFWPIGEFVTFRPVMFRPATFRPVPGHWPERETFMPVPGDFQANKKNYVECDGSCEMFKGRARCSRLVQDVHVSKSDNLATYYPPQSVCLETLSSALHSKFSQVCVVGRKRKATKKVDAQPTEPSAKRVRPEPEPTQQQRSPREAYTRPSAISIGVSVRVSFNIVITPSDHDQLAEWRSRYDIPVPIREDTVELRQRAVIPVAQTVPLVPYDSSDDDREDVDDEQYNWHVLDSALRKRKKTTEEGYASNKQTQAQRELNSNLLRKKAMVTSHK
ncbi:hypothetical protein DAPPUDRAFT_105562 [Daphnia pulex]|uniref:Uncharacterized protein n=1 Tax=Daphnia pulex TaxID=6669 RepID=E9GR42_DAPPU|nr:hypothetical protein DAPPUDRAFT_105562 [Daphnia pulex]|eukprot:EFX78059.1 hypothetical protein DAPPUDRAFT_105562 [Daphnia pulex]